MQSELASSLLQLCGATGLGLHTTWNGPHQFAASSGASLQRFGGGVRARLPPALGTFKEAELWGGKGRRLRVGKVNKVKLSSLLSLH